MNKVLKIVGITAVILIALYIAATFYASHRIANFLENDFLETSVKLDNVSVNLLLGNASISGFTTGKASTTAINKVTLSDLSYYELLFNNTVEINELAISDYTIELPLALKESKGDTKAKNIIIKNFSSKKGNLYQTKADTIKLKVFNINAAVKDITFNTKTPLKTTAYSIDKISMDSLFNKMSISEDLFTKSITLTADRLIVNDFLIATNPMQRDIIKKDGVNKDELDIAINKITARDYDLNLTETPFLTVNKTIIDSLNISVAANNNLDPSSEPRPTYAELLRNLDFKFKVDTLAVKNAQVTYSEPDEAATTRGAISFENINATFNNVHNVKNGGDITMRSTSTFMNSSLLTTNYTMNPYDLNSAFKWTGDLDTFSLDRIDRFLNPVFNIKVEGEVKKYLFSIYGNKDRLDTDIKINYTDGKIIFQNKDKSKKGLLNTFANLLAKNDTNGNLVSEKGSLERDNTTTFFNQVWEVQRDALMKVVK